MKSENLDMAIEVIKGAAGALDMINSKELDNLEQTELFRALTSHNIAQLESDVSSYVNALKQVREIVNRNGGKLPADDPSIKQQLIKAGIIGQSTGDGYEGDSEDFRSALAGVFGGYDFL